MAEQKDFKDQSPGKTSPTEKANDDPKTSVPPSLGDGCFDQKSLFSSKDAAKDNIVDQPKEEDATVLLTQAHYLEVDKMITKGNEPKNQKKDADQAQSPCQAGSVDPIISSNTTAKGHSLLRTTPSVDCYMPLPSDFVQIFVNPKEQVQFKTDCAHSVRDPVTEVPAKKPVKTPTDFVHLYNSKLDVMPLPANVARPVAPHEPKATVEANNKTEPTGLAADNALNPVTKDQPTKNNSKKERKSISKSSLVKERIIKCRNGVPESLIKAIKTFMDKQK